ncbi:PD-(D/E)XK nuclease-like domain-containing protein [bacterium]|nr:PD-(D/E)XK nuclease-like domain-containing protein [bacterium]
MATIKEQVVQAGSDFKPVPGVIFSGVLNEVYHSERMILSSSGLKKISNETIFHYLDDPGLETKAMSLGDYYHGALDCNISGTDINDHVCVVPDYPKSAVKPIVQFLVDYSPDDPDRIKLMQKPIKELKEAAAELEKKLAKGRKVVSQSQFERAQGMAKALREHPKVGKLFNMRGIPELSFYQKIPINIDGEIVWVMVRVRPDLLIESETEIWIIDWKSIGKVATRHNIIETMKMLRYDMSGGLYREVVSLFTDKIVKFFLVFAESFRPAKEKVVMLEMLDSDLTKGMTSCRIALEKFARWQLKKGWSGHECDNNLGYHTDFKMWE